MRHRILSHLAGVVCAAALGLVAASNAAALDDAEVAKCMRCHESEKVSGIFGTGHMRPDDPPPNSPARKERCESCHGPSREHMRFPLRVGNIRFSKHDESTAAAVRNRACLECHNEGDRAHWRMSPHGFDKVSCTDCHVVHRVREPKLTEKETTFLCSDGCHQKILAQRPAISGHPLVGEKRIGCTSCHNPHGPLDMAACSACHPHGAAELARQTEKARSYHERALTKEIRCTECHQGTAHGVPSLDTPNGEGGEEQAGLR